MRYNGRNYGYRNGRRMMSEAWNPSSYDKVQKALDQIIAIYHSLGSVSPEVEDAFKTLYERLEGSSSGTGSAGPASAEPSREGRPVGGGLMGGATNRMAGSGAGSSAGSSAGSGVGAGSGIGSMIGKGNNGRVVFTDGLKGVELTAGDVDKAPDGTYHITTHFLSQFFTGALRAHNYGRQDESRTPVKQMRSMAEESLANGFCAFKYLKKEDGSIRTAIGTTNPSLIRLFGGDVNGGDNYAPYQVPYFDLQKNDWRSFIYSNIRELY